MREYRDPVSDNLRWAGFVHRPGDIFVCTPPKTGTTWTQCIVWSLLWPDGDGPVPVMEVQPWLDARFAPIEDVLARLDAQDHRRSIKTHTPADGIPWFDDAHYLFVGRDGRDVCMSHANHRANIRRDVMAALVASAAADGIDVSRPPGAADDIHAFIGSYLDGGSFFEAVRSFWERRHQPNVLLVHYADMLRGLEAEMRRIGAFLDIDVPQAKWPAVVERCTFAAMKADADRIGDLDRLFNGGANTFFFKGTNGRWRDVFTPEELARYDEREAELLDPECAAWLREGRAGGET